VRYDVAAPRPDHEGDENADRHHGLNSVSSRMGRTRATVCGMVKLSPHIG